MEQANTYFVEDSSNNRMELKRLQVLDRILTADMGGVLPEQPERIFKRVLDVGCGAGGWLIELAKQQPEGEFIGVDANRTVVEYARKQASAAGVSHQVEFHVADALRMLEFPADYFDLVNHRAAASWLRTWDWPKLLQEYQRVCRSLGTIRVTELDWFITNSPAFSRFSDLFLKALDRSGHLFSFEGNGVTKHLSHLFSQHGINQVQERMYTLEYCLADGERWQSFFENMEIVCRVSHPFLRKWGQVPNDYDALCQQFLKEFQDDGFVAKANVLTVWGTK